MPPGRSICWLAGSVHIDECARFLLGFAFPPLLVAVTGLLVAFRANSSIERWGSGRKVRAQLQYFHIRKDRNDGNKTPD